jgi:predicted CXXCH cytochrome family protein
VPLAALALSALSGCVDEKIVYRDRDLFEDPLTNAGSFLGYTDAASQLTVCGNCHVEKQAEWKGTAHAGAWATLEGIGQSDNAVCQGCHTVNENGNTVIETAGFNATGEDRYHDVQCESCHGPGLTHVTNPTQATVPLPPLNVGVDATEGCGECHAGSHHPFVEEWTQSRHGTMDAYPQGRADCESCHTGEGALAAFGVKTAYLEQADVENNLANNLPITCAVCHDPHDATNAGQLRFPVDVADVDTNLCMKCHHKRSIPDEGTTSRGPHSPQGPLLLGEVGSVGWTPPNFAYNAQTIRGTHGSERNTRLCATCHVNSYEVTDAETGEFIVTATGHLFKPIPCVDAQGVPTADDSCPKDEASRNWTSCTASGCHGDATAAKSAYNSATTRIADLVTELTDLLAQVPSTEFSSTDTVFTVAEGARFNQQLGEITSSAIHNPFLTEALLSASITVVKDTYGLPAQTGVQLGTIWPQIVHDID